MNPINKVDRIKVVTCLSSKVLEKDENCNVCRDRNCCLTINPELASIVEKSKKSDGTYEFTPTDGSLINRKYPRAPYYDKIGEMHLGIMPMRDWIVEAYYSTKIMPSIISKFIVTKLENDNYTDEEIELLYAVLTDKYDEMLGM